MTETITIKRYSEDYGQGRVIAIYDNGNPADQMQKCTFDTLTDALAWVGRVAESKIPLSIKDEIAAINKDRDAIRGLVQFLGGSQE